MAVQQFGPHVRTRTDDNRVDQPYEVIEELKDGRWVEYARFGHISNDYALTEARRLAQSLARKHFGKH